jgi:cytidylate kinase
MINITVIAGKICSGKTTTAKAIMYGLNCDDDLSCQRHGSKIGIFNDTPINRIHCCIIEVSDIVKTLIGSISRQSLQETEYLDESIAITILTMIENNSHVSDWIINGLRQPSIFEVIQKKYPQVTGIWIEVSHLERKRRFLARGSDKDQFDISYYDVRDEQLGLMELKKLITQL